MFNISLKTDGFSSSCCTIADQRAAIQMMLVFVCAGMNTAAQRAVAAAMACAGLEFSPERAIPAPPNTQRALCQSCVCRRNVAGQAVLIMYLTHSRGLGCLPTC